MTEDDFENEDDLSPEDLEIADVVGQFVEKRKGFKNCTDKDLDAVIDWVKMCHINQGLIRLISQGIFDIEVHDGEVDFGLTEKGSVVDQSILDSGLDEVVSFLMTTAKEYDFNSRLVQDNMSLAVSEFDEHVDNMETEHGETEEMLDPKIGNSQLWYLKQRKKK